MLPAEMALDFDGAHLEAVRILYLRYSVRIVSRPRLVDAGRTFGIRRYTFYILMPADR